MPSGPTGKTPASWAGAAVTRSKTPRAASERRIIVGAHAGKRGRYHRCKADRRRPQALTVQWRKSVAAPGEEMLATIRHAWNRLRTVARPFLQYDRRWWAIGLFAVIVVLLLSRERTERPE